MISATPLYTEDDMQILFSFHKSCQALFHHLDLDPFTPAARSLNNPTKVMVFEQQFRPYVMAWAAWSTSFRSQQKIMWLKQQVRSHGILVDDFLALLREMDRYAADLVNINRNHLAFANESLIRFASLSPSSLRGFSCNAIICDSMTRQDIHSEFYTSFMPMLYRDNSTLIVILP